MSGGARQCWGREGNQRQRLEKLEAFEGEYLLHADVYCQG